MNRLALFLGLIAFLVASPAAAANWLKGCQGPGSAVVNLAPGTFACNDPDGSIIAPFDDSSVLQVTACENIDILVFPDLDGDAVASGFQAQLMSCPGTTASVNACWAAEGVTLDGIPGGLEVEAIYGLGANWVFLNVTAWTVGTEPVRVIVKCNGPSQ